MDDGVSAANESHSSHESDNDSDDSPSMSEAAQDALSGSDFGNDNDNDNDNDDSGPAPDTSASGPSAANDNDPADDDEAPAEATTETPAAAVAETEDAVEDEETTEVTPPPDTWQQDLAETWAETKGEVMGVAAAATGFVADMLGGALAVGETVVDSVTVGIEAATGLINDDYAARQSAELQGKIDATVDAVDAVLEDGIVESATDLATAMAEKYEADFAYADALESAYQSGHAPLSALTEAAAIRSQAQTELGIMGVETAATFVGVGAVAKGLRAARTLDRIDGPSPVAMARTQMTDTQARTEALQDLVEQGRTEITPDVIDQQVAATRLPRSNGTWDGEPGNGTWHPDNEAARSVIGDEGVPFTDGRPDFSQWSRGELEFEPGQLDGTRADFDLVYDEVMEARGLPSRNAAREYLREQGLTPHHRDTTTIELVPTDLHGNVPHAGGASDLRRGL